MRLRVLPVVLLLTLPALAVPWNAGLSRPLNMKPMPQMRIVNSDRPGEHFDLKEELSPGHYNVVDFFADW